MPRDRRVEDIAARQHGVISRRQAISMGYTITMIRGRVDRGLWRQLDREVFAIAGAPATWERRLGAALLSRPLAYAAGRSAAHLHGFPGFPKSKPEILVPFPGNARSPICRVIRSRLFDKVDHQIVQGFVATSPAETILTISFREPTAVVARIVDDRLSARQLKIEHFDPILDRLDGARMRGLPGLRRIVAERDEHGYQPPASELERLLYLLLDHPKLPEYNRQLPIDYPKRRSTVDAYIPSWRLIAEGDSRRWHTRVQDFEVDRTRDNAALAAGLAVVRFTYNMLLNEADECLQTLLEAGRWRESA